MSDDMSSTQYRKSPAFLKRCFARHCVRHLNERAPSGLTWAEVFKRKYNQTLWEYKDEFLEACGKDGSEIVGRDTDGV